MKKEIVDTLVKKNPRISMYRGTLDNMEIGAYCLHKSWGFGKIIDFDESAFRVIIDFEGENAKKNHSMDMAFCATTLEVLDSQNIIVRARTETAVVEKMKKEKSPLIIEILKNAKNMTMSPIEIERVLSLIFAPEDHKKWWTATKKVLVKDPRISTPKKKTDPFVLREESKEVSPEEEIWEEYIIIKNPKKKIALAEKLYAISEDVDSIAEKLPQIREELTNAIKNTKTLTPADRLHGLWVRNDLVRHICWQDALEEEKTILQKKVETFLEDNAKKLSTNTNIDDFSKLVENTLVKVIKDSKSKIETLDKTRKECLSQIKAEGTCSNQDLEILDLCLKFLISNLKDTAENAVESLEPTSKSIILETQKLEDLAKDLPASYSERFLDLITRVFEDKADEIILKILSSATPKFVNSCISFLLGKEKEDLVKFNLEKWLSEQSLKSSVIQWVVKNRNSGKYREIVTGFSDEKISYYEDKKDKKYSSDEILLLKKSLIGPKLFHSLLYAIDNEALQNASTKRILLADVLSEDKPLVGDMLKNSFKRDSEIVEENVSGEIAKDLAQTLLINQGFDDLTKRSLIARFIQKYPKIQALITEAKDEEEGLLLVSSQSLENRKQELEHLIKVAIPNNLKAIEIAREHGDLSENSEYKMAREEQATLAARRGYLQNDIARARVTDFTNAPVGSVGIGTIVEVIRGSDGKEKTYTILGAWDSIPEKNILSYLTPLAESLLEKKAGEKATVNIDGNKEEWTIKSVVRWIDKKA